MRPREASRVGRLIDALCRGASPPGMIDMVHARHAHLRRRFTMIARYDGKSGRWSTSGLAVSLLVGVVALTGAVRGQNAQPDAPSQPAAATPAPQPQQPEAQPAAGEAKPAAAPQPARRNPNFSAVGAAAGQPDVTAAVHDEDADAAVLAQLNRKVQELSFDGAPLSDVLDFVRDVSDINLVVEWGTLENAGLARDTPVSLKVRDVTVAHALELVLGDAGRGSVPLGYTIDRNVVRVATGEQLNRYTDIRAYDVRDVVPAEMPMEDLKRLVTEAVAPDSWREAGGSVGAVHTSKHKLIVTQTPMNHRQIREILEMLREQPQETPRAADAASAAQGPAGTLQRR